MNIKKMAYSNFNELLESEFDKTVSKRDKLQDLNFNQLKVEVHDTYKKHERKTSNFQHPGNSDAMIRGYLDVKLLKIKGH